MPSFYKREKKRKGDVQSHKFRSLIRTKPILIVLEAERVVTSELRVVMSLSNLSFKEQMEVTHHYQASSTVMLMPC